MCAILQACQPPQAACWLAGVRAGCTTPGGCDGAHSWEGSSRVRGAGSSTTNCAADLCGVQHGVRGVVEVQDGHLAARPQHSVQLPERLQARCHPPPRGLSSAGLQHGSANTMPRHGRCRQGLATTQRGHKPTPADAGAGGSGAGGGGAPGDADRAHLGDVCHVAQPVAHGCCVKLALTKRQLQRVTLRTASRG